MNERPEILMTPGPTPVPPAVLAAQAVSPTHHRTKTFGALLEEVTEGLKWLIDTENEVFIYTSSGTGAMEAAVANVTSPGDRVLVVSVGYFGERFKMICERFGCRVTFLEYEWGKTAKAADVAKALDESPGIKAVCIQHSETSTGVVNDIEPIAREVKSRDRLLVLDAVSSAGAIELHTDAWGIDVALGGSQKALGASPGIAFVAVSEKAWEAHAKAKAPRFYWDWTFYKEAAERDPMQPPWTPAISVLYGVRVSLALARKEGREQIHARHVRLGQAVRAGVQALGLDVLGEDPERAHVVTAVRVPEGLTDAEIVGLLASKHRIIIEKGQGPLRGQIFRIGHLGWVGPLDIIQFFGALEMVLTELGYTAKRGAAVAAAEEVLK